VPDRARRRGGGDPLRIAVWRLEAGAGGDAALFAAAARQGLAAADAALAERLAQAAVDAGGGVDARLTLGRALAAAGRGPEAQRLFADLGADARADRERAAVALASARNLFWALDRAAEADAVLPDAEERVSDRALRDELTAQRVRLVAAQGRPPEALTAARAVLEDESVSERARTTAALGAVEALFSSGRATRRLRWPRGRCRPPAGSGRSCRTRSRSSSACGPWRCGSRAAWSRRRSRRRARMRSCYREGPRRPRRSRRTPWA
jgi:hypothetical protein